ncbi:MAG: DUF2066 domain-containing protein [Stenotrophobium sp.]
MYKNLLSALALLLMAAVLGLNTSTAQAQTAADYIARVPVADQSDAARTPALRAALAAVIGRATGDASAVNGRAAPLLARAASYLQQYSYLTDSQGQQQLQAAFDPKLLDSALHGLGYPVWGIAPAAVDEVTLAVSGVSTPRQYAHLMSYLQNQPGVSSLSVIEIDGSTLHLSLRMEGGAQRLAGAFSVSGLLSPHSNSVPGELDYSLNP